MSGAGKSSVLDALEDLGWDVVDNLPADLLGSFVNAGAECRVAPAAVGMDVRSRGFDPVALIVELTGEFQRLPDDSPERQILAVRLPLISVDAMTASAASKVALGLDRLGLRF